jgi:hypothetical protein
MFIEFFAIAKMVADVLINLLTEKCTERLLSWYVSDFRRFGLKSESIVLYSFLGRFYDIPVLYLLIPSRYSKLLLLLWPYYLWRVNFYVATRRRFRYYWKMITLLCAHLT